MQSNSLSSVQICLNNTQEQTLHLIKRKGNMVFWVFKCHIENYEFTIYLE